MKFGIVDGAFPSEWSLEKLFKSAKKFGYDGVELWLSENGAVNLNSNKEDMINIKNTADKYGISLYSLSNQLCWNYSLTAESEEERSMAKKIIRKQLELASYLGCNTVLVLAGAVGVDFIKDFKMVDYDVAYNRALESLKELKEDAEKYKVNIALENVGNKFLLSPIEMKAFIDEINSPYIGVYFDVGNVMPIGYPEQWIKILKNRIKKIHLKDYLRSEKKSVPLLMGDVDYASVIKELKNINYDDFITSEYVYNEDNYINGNKETINAMKKIISL